MIRPTPRYVGSLTEVHGEVLAVDPCDCAHCAPLPEWEHEHARLLVLPDAGGRAVRLERVHFASFTGRP